MYYGGGRKLRGLGFGVKAKVQVPVEIKSAAAEFPAFRQEFGRFTAAIEKFQMFLPWVIIGTAAVVAFVVIAQSGKKE